MFFHPLVLIKNICLPSKEKKGCLINTINHSRWPIKTQFQCVDGELCVCVYIYIGLVLHVHKIKKIGGGKKTYGVFSY